MSEEFTKEDQKELDRLEKKKDLYENSGKKTIRNCIDKFYYRDEPTEELVDDFINNAQEITNVLKQFLK